MSIEGIVRRHGMYTLRFPFSLPIDQEIMTTEQVIELNGLSFSLKSESRFYILIINGFSTEDKAQQYINNVWAGLMWMLLHCGLPPDVVLELQSFNELIDGSRPVVYPSKKPPSSSIIQYPVTVTITTPVELVFRFFCDGVNFPASAKVIDDPKLRIALELYGASFKEFSENAKFLALVMALEALATGTPREKLISDLLDKWKKEVEELKKTVKSSDEADSLESLNRELLFRKEDSIRQQIRTLVLTTLKDNGDKNAAEIAKSAVKVYDLRSTLVHKGELKPKVLNKATFDSKNIVERVLRARFVQNATLGKRDV
jgi:hypothetical protein